MIDEDNNPIPCGHALPELLGIKLLQNMVFPDWQSAFQLKTNEFCWIGEDLCRIVELKNPMSKVKRLTATGECDDFGNKVFRISLLDVLSSNIGDYAHIFHYCQSCHTFGTTIMHSEDEFVLNAYRFKENDSDY
jgi:hypothetical protein